MNANGLIRLLLVIIGLASMGIGTLGMANGAVAGIFPFLVGFTCILLAWRR